MSVFVMQVRRELWEHRSLWIAPLLVAALLLLAVATVGRVQFYLGPASAGVASSPFELMLFGWGVPFYLVVGIVSAVYLLDCLYGERRDRSILFWRSLPVSDTQTVIAKLLVGLAIVPLGTFLLAAATSVVASGILAARHHVLLAGGAVAFAPVAHAWLSAQLRMLAALIVWLLWYAPYAAYLLLASAWARRSPYAWAFIPPVLAAMFENIVFGTHYLGSIVTRGFDQMLRLGASLNLRLAFNVGTTPIPGGLRAAVHASNAGLLLGTQLWVGLAAAAVMVLLAIRLRRYRGDS